MDNKIKAVIPALAAVAVAALMMAVIPRMTQDDLTLKLTDEDSVQLGVVSDGSLTGDYREFCEYAASQAAEILGEDARGTYTVKTSFDKNAYEACQTAVSQSDSTLSDTASVITSTDGRILGIYSTGDGVNHATAKKQPYSAFKPLSVYAPALESGAITWADSFHDSPVKQVADENGKLSDWPVNATGEYRNENVALEDCIKYSINTVAVRCLMHSGVTQSADFLSERLGIDVSSEKELARNEGEEEILHNLALGYLTAGVSPVDMAGYYGIFATGGKYITPYAVLEISDEEGNVVYEHEAQAVQVISEETAFIMNKLLQNTLTSGGTAEKAQYEDLVIGGKTGTGSNYSGNWFVGYTPQYCCAVWHGQSRKNFCTEIFSDIMGGLEHDKTKEFPVCDNVIMKVYCKESGGMLTLNCNSMATGYFKSDCCLIKCEKH